MTTAAIRIAHATESDLPAIAEISTRSWQQAYAGQIDQSFLDSIDVENRLQNWRMGFHQYQEDNGKALFIAFSDDKPVGFIACGPSREDSYNTHGEIYAVYLLHDNHSKGVGHALYQTARAHLGTDRPAYLWVLSTNVKAMAAYTKWGGIVHPDQIKDHVIGEQAVQEYRVIFA